MRVRAGVLLVVSLLVASACNSEPSVDTSEVERLRYETVRIAGQQPTVIIARGWPPMDVVPEWDSSGPVTKDAVLSWLASHVDATPFRATLDCRGFSADRDISDENARRAVDALRDAQLLQLLADQGTLLQSVDDFYAANPSLDPETTEFVNRAGIVEDDLDPEACDALEDWAAFVSDSELLEYTDRFPAPATLSSLRQVVTTP